MKYILSAVFVLFVGLLSADAQDKDTANNRRLIESKNFIFKAQSASPMRGGIRYLTSEYDLRIKGDSLVSWLPFFGRAYSIPYNSTDGPYQFTSVQFDYVVNKKKEHRWDITIKPKDAPEVQTMFLTLFDSGSALLRVNSVNRESISFNGYFVADKGSAKKGF